MIFHFRMPSPGIYLSTCTVWQWDYVRLVVDTSNKWYPIGRGWFCCYLGGFCCSTVIESRWPTRVSNLFVILFTRLPVISVFGQRPTPWLLQQPKQKLHKNQNQNKNNSSNITLLFYFIPFIAKARVLFHLIAPCSWLNNNIYRTIFCPCDISLVLDVLLHTTQ